MSHANAELTPRARLRLARLVVEQGWAQSMAAKMFMVSPKTVRKWADRYRTEGTAGMVDRSSRPYHSPAKTPEAVKRKIVALRWRTRRGPVQIAGRLGMPASTVHAVLVRCGLNRLSRIDRVTGEPLRRYEHDHPGALIHVDVTKFGNIPDGGGQHRCVRPAPARHDPPAWQAGQCGVDTAPPHRSAARGMSAASSPWWSRVSVVPAPAPRPVFRPPVRRQPAARGMHPLRLHDTLNGSQSRGNVVPGGCGVADLGGREHGNQPGPICPPTPRNMAACKESVASRRGPTQGQSARAE